MAADRRRLSVVPAVATAPGRPLSGSASAVATTPLFPVWWASNDCYLEQGIARSVLPLCVGFNAERPLTGTTAERLLMAGTTRSRILPTAAVGQTADRAEGLLPGAAANW